MEIILHNVPKLILLMAIAGMLGILPQTLAVWIPFIVIRRYSAGLHARNGYMCTIMTLLMFAVVPYFFQNISINITSLGIVFFVVAVCLNKYAPADTANRPILGYNKRKKLKRSALLAACIIFMVTLFFVEARYHLLVAIGSSYATMAILPITYKILNRSVNNYEKYER